MSTEGGWQNSLCQPLRRCFSKEDISSGPAVNGPNALSPSRVGAKGFPLLPVSNITQRRNSSPRTTSTRLMMRHKHRCCLKIPSYSCPSSHHFEVKVLVLCWVHLIRIVGKAGLITWASSSREVNKWKIQQPDPVIKESIRWGTHVATWAAQKPGSLGNVNYWSQRPAERPGSFLLNLSYITHIVPTGIQLVNLELCVWYKGSICHKRCSINMVLTNEQVSEWTALPNNHTIYPNK